MSVLPSALCSFRLCFNLERRSCVATFFFFSLFIMTFRDKLLTHCWQIVAQNIILWQKYYFVDKLRLTHAPSSSSEDCVVHFWSSVRSWDGYFYFINTTLTDIAQSFFNIECQTEWFIYLFGALNLCAISYWHIDIGFSQIQFELKIWLQPPAVDEKVHWSTDPQKQMVEAHLKSKTLMTL